MFLHNLNLWIAISFHNPPWITIAAFSILSFDSNSNVSWWIRASASRNSIVSESLIFSSDRLTDLEFVFWLVDAFSSSNVIFETAVFISGPFTRSVIWLELNVWSSSKVIFRDENVHVISEISFRYLPCSRKNNL